MQYEVSKTLAARRNLLQIEVQSYTGQTISRRCTKENLNFINISVLNKYVNNKIFDNFWYLNREKNMKKKTYIGFIVSLTTGKVEQYQ